MIVTERPPFLPFMEDRLSRLPGVVPLEAPDWIVAPGDINAQLAYRDTLINERRADVLATTAEGVEPSVELLDLLLQNLASRQEWQISKNEVIRPDQLSVPIDRRDPLLTLGRIVSEDFCILLKPEKAKEYVLVAAALCFPAGWVLSEKLGRAMTGIHAPVPHYTGDLARRVNRIFDGIRPDRLLLRCNWSLPVIPELYATPQNIKKASETLKEKQHYLRVERQTFRRLPKTQAVAFGIRTTVSPISNLSPCEAETLLRHLAEQGPEVSRYKDGGDYFEQTCARLCELSEASGANSIS